MCGAVAVLGEGERDSGDLPGYLADDRPEPLDAEPGVGPRLVDHQVAQTERETVDSLVCPDQERTPQCSRSR